MNYYDILQCSKDATVEELKKSYQSLILKHHPDKQTERSSKELDDDKFHRIDTAYKVLRDPESRKIYDAELMQQEFCEKPLIFATLHRKEFIRDQDTDLLIKTCRCGGIYIFPEDEDTPGEENILISCDECSLVIEVTAK
ncbi:dnaJ homolog subfamily C member 24-like [Phlebotomus argentipes]|uniref:dnaJ homolog subfamily C member 24-like n=1 Tax=Phlebotomus argentipes TaxID=94469 RepID=UPI002892DC5B|nr:dnaJ homolog subfamily C member 24-like [Phlebotomus argentipes]